MCVGGIECYMRCVPYCTGMVMPGILLAQSFKSITCFGCATHMKGALAVLAVKVFWGLVSVFMHACHFRLSYKGVIWFVVAVGI